MNAFPQMLRLAENAFMHFQEKRRHYPTAPGRALLELCLRKELSSGRGIKLTRIHQGELTVNHNALEKATKDSSLKLTQPTITRLLKGKLATSTKTFKALAKFFDVSIGVVMGEEEPPLPGNAAPEDEIGARLWNLWGHVPRSAKLECLEIAIRATPDGLQDVPLDSQKKSED